MNIPEILDFLRRLAANNNRPWFQEHKTEYQHVQLDFEELVAAVIARISGFDESVSHVQPKDCTYINAKGKKSNHCGYYIHLEPDNCMLAGGSWCMPSDMLRAVRQSVYDNIDEFRAIVEDPAFKAYFPIIGEEHLKTMPKGFPKDFPYPQYIQCKDYIVSCRIPDSFFDNPQFLAFCRLYEFYNRRF